MSDSKNLSSLPEPSRNDNTFELTYHLLFYGEFYFFIIYRIMPKIRSGVKKRFVGKMKKKVLKIRSGRKKNILDFF